MISYRLKDKLSNCCWCWARDFHYFQLFHYFRMVDHFHDASLTLSIVEAFSSRQMKKEISITWKTSHTPKSFSQAHYKSFIFGVKTVISRNRDRHKHVTSRRIRSGNWQDIFFPSRRRWMEKADDGKWAGLIGGNSRKIVLIYFDNVVLVTHQFPQFYVTFKALYIWRFPGFHISTCCSLIPAPIHNFTLNTMVHHKTRIYF